MKSPPKVLKTTAMRKPISANTDANPKLIKKNNLMMKSLFRLHMILNLTMDLRKNKLLRGQKLKKFNPILIMSTIGTIKDKIMNVKKGMYPLFSVFI